MAQITSKYRPIRRIAIGGMSEILLAAQQGLAGFEKLVVVKRILPHMREDGEFVQMFLDEARLAASLRHPNVVEIFDCYRDDSNFFLAMEYLSGEDLRYIIGKARKGELNIPPAVSARILCDAAEGLDYAHNAQDVEGHPLLIVHRDAAPSNIIVTYNGTVKLVDFGIAKANISNVYTKPGSLKGKFAYMSPEQAQHKELDRRSDVFTLGVVAWELLTARRLFKGPSEAAVLRSVIEDHPKSPSKVNPAVPPALDRVVLKALEKDPERRTASAGIFRDEIAAAMGAAKIADTHAVSKWMQTDLKSRYEQRLETEREVGREARENHGGTLDDESFPMLFGRARGSARSSGSLTGYTKTGASVSVVEPSLTTSQRANAGRSVMWAVIGAFGALAIGALMFLAFTMGKKEKSGPAFVETVAQQPSPPELSIRATPPGGHPLRRRGAPGRADRCGRGKCAGGADGAYPAADREGRLPPVRDHRCGARVRFQ